MNCPNCQADFSLWESFKLSNIFRVVCSSCSDEVVKDTGGFAGFRSSVFSVMSCGFLTVLFFDHMSFWCFALLLPIQLYFDNHFSSLKSLGSTKPQKLDCNSHITDK
jgi:ribosomal protein S27E